MSKICGRETEWHCADGKIIKVKNLEDRHLANIIKHIQIYNYGEEILNVMVEEANLRGLKQEFLDRAHIPYQNDRGRWMLWSTERHRDVEVG